MLAAIRRILGMTPAAPPPVEKPAKAKRSNNGNGGKKAVAIERTCPHCGTTAKGPVYFRNHGDRCKQNPANMAEPPLPLQQPATAAE